MFFTMVVMGTRGPHVCNTTDDTTIVGLISNNNKEAYREEVSFLTDWCRENNLSLNVDKTKELIVDFRKQERVHTPITINGIAVERGCNTTNSLLTNPHLQTGGEESVETCHRENLRETESV
ncbi:hypothetical protein NFI96_005197 [Prochilodus magdalenae]|nr:hypothetical protein NFI96_005197 [Prochilodus magdalenae]